jgi:tetratricopeptide (TPR) repeat protein
MVGAVLIRSVMIGRACFVWSLLATPALFAVDSETTRPRPVDAKQIQSLIADLGADDYFTREKAQAELTEIGAEAFDALSEAADRVRDVEVAERIAYLLRTIRVRWVDKSDPVEVRELLQNYEGMGEPDRNTVIDGLGNLPGTAGATALCRIVRFEPSLPLSKRAAIKILEQKPSPDVDPAKRRAVLEAGTGASPRPAADWIRKSLNEATDPASVAEAFTTLVDAEEQVLRQFPHRSKPEIVLGLLRYQVGLFKKLNRPQDMVAAMMRMIAFEQGGAEAAREGKFPILIEVLQTLTELKDWATVDQVVERFNDRVQQDSLTAYVVARAFQVKGDEKQAKRYAEIALKMDPGDQRKHIVMGIDLRNRGWIDWAEEEYRAAIAMGTPTQAFTLIAQFQLGESLHDRGDDLAAAKILDEATAGIQAAAGQGLDVSDAGRGLEANRARAHFFYALHFRDNGDPKKCLQHLLDGLKDDQYDTEILIELFRLPDLDASTRDRVRRLVRESADIYRRQMSDRPDDDTPYNQFAWLISNTEGDFQEAIAASKKSLELKPESAGHMDTLARCYFAPGELENAVKEQRRAIDLDPHSQQMKRQLKIFEEALAKKEKR